MDTEVVWAKWFGFPQCCVDSFILDRSRGFISGHGRENRKLSGTGYIPCKTCDTIYTEAELTSKINSARISPAPFPSNRNYQSVEFSIQTILSSDKFNYREKRAIVESYPRIAARVLFANQEAM